MGVRAGQGYGQKKPKRARCPDCGKHGLTTWKATPHGVLNRQCQYCLRQENKPIDAKRLGREKGEGLCQICGAPEPCNCNNMEGLG